MISTDRLQLRPLRAADRDDVMRIGGQRAVADATISVPHPFTAEAATDWIARYLSGETAIGWAVADRSDGAFIGFVGLNHIDAEHRQAELSFWIDPARNGAGLATEAARAAIDYAFSGTPLNRLEAYHMVKNTGSQRVLEKLGFKREGALRQRVLKNGEFEDVLLWSRLKADPAAPQGLRSPG